jgi:DegV family protein with EDD domain
MFENGGRIMFVLFTDTDTDITPEVAKEYDYHLISMPYIIDNKEVYPYVDFDHFESKKFYDLLRSGVVPKTCGISPMSYYQAFEPFFKEGKDVLYVHFSSAMSSTFSAMNLAIEQLKEKYPERHVYTIDTYGITICSYVLVREIGDRAKKGASLEELMNWAKEEVQHFATYFYADDLKFFAKSGRVSGFSGFMGNIFGIHPIICMDKNGQMDAIGKERGRVSSLRKMLEYVEKLGDHIKDYRLIVGHTDAIEPAEMFGKMLKEKFGDDLNIEYVVVNPTAGSHCGPSCVGVSFHAIHR